MGCLIIWWRRRESNPRPSVLRPQIYMLSHIYDLTLTNRIDTGSERVYLVLAGFALDKTRQRSCDTSPRIQLTGILSSGLAIMRLVRSCRRWQLNWFAEIV